MKIEKALAKALSHSNDAEIKEVYAKVYEEYHGLIAFVLHGYLNDPCDVEDLVDETFLRFFAYDKKDEIRSIKSFLVQSAKNLALTQLEKPRHETLEEDQPSSQDPMTLFLLDLRSYLSPLELDLLYDYYVYDLDAASIGKTKGLSPSAVRMQITRLKKKIRSRFGGTNK